MISTNIKQNMFLSKTSIHSVDRSECVAGMDDPFKAIWTIENKAICESARQSLGSIHSYPVAMCIHKLIHTHTHRLCVRYHDLVYIP